MRDKVAGALDSAAAMAAARACWPRRRGSNCCCPNPGPPSDRNRTAPRGMAEEIRCDIL